MLGAQVLAPVPVGLNPLPWLQPEISQVSGDLELGAGEVLDKQGLKGLPGQVWAG